MDRRLPAYAVIVAALVAGVLGAAAGVFGGLYFGEEGPTGDRGPRGAIGPPGAGAEEALDRVEIVESDLSDLRDLVSEIDTDLASLESDVPFNLGGSILDLESGMNAVERDISTLCREMRFQGFNVFCF